jgi:hypothetical protein
MEDPSAMILASKLRSKSTRHIAAVGIGVDARERIHR